MTTQCTIWSTQQPWPIGNRRSRSRGWCLLINRSRLVLTTIDRLILMCWGSFRPQFDIVILLYVAIITVFALSIIDALWKGLFVQRFIRLGLFGLRVINFLNTHTHSYIMIVRNVFQFFFSFPVSQKYQGRQREPVNPLSVEYIYK